MMFALNLVFLEFCRSTEKLDTHRPFSNKMLFTILILSLPLLSAFEEQLGFLEETADCVKDQPPSQSPNFQLYPATYEQLVKYNDFFIDKTLLLKEIFHENTSYLTIFYLPRKFAKSINLQMIRTFAEISLDSNHTPIPRENTFAYDFFTRGKISHENSIVELLRKPPLISGYSDTIDQHLGQYPIIYLNFSSLQDADFISTWNCLKDRVGSEFLRYSFLTSKISTNDSDRFCRLVEYFNRTQGIGDRERGVELSSGIECLAKTVREFFGKKPILLIDDFDSYIDSFMHEHYAFKSEDDKVIKFFAQFVRVFGKIGAWHRIILTGTYSIFKTNLDFLRQTKKIYHALDNDISHFFGFTETDLKLLSGHFQISEDQLEQAREYYNGYTMGPNYPIYNPWSIVKYFLTKQLENHWEQTFRHRNFLKNLFIIDKMRNVWIGFLGDRTRCATHFFESYSENDMWIMKTILATKTRTNALSPRKFTQTLMYLADTGHVTWMRYREPDPTKMFNAWLPNQDIRLSTFHRLREAYMKHLNVKIALADEAAAKLHSYLSSDRPGQLFLDVMRSFEQLYNKSEPLFEKDKKYREPKPRNIARHIVDYIGLRMRYRHEYRVDPMFMSGFLLRKDNISYVINFNYNQSIESGDVLERLKNYTHPWTVRRFETRTVKYVVISIGNDTDPHMLSYTANLPPDYSPPTKIDTIFTTVSSAGDNQTKDIEEQSPFTEESTSINVGNFTEMSQNTDILTDVEFIQNSTIFENDATISGETTSAVETT